MNFVPSDLARFLEDKFGVSIGSKSPLPARIQPAAKAFQKKRFAYFENLASLIEASDGKMSYMVMFEKEAQRYAGTPRGELSAYWVERMHETGARLSESWVGSVPQDELAVFAIAEKRGRGSVATALRDLARVGGAIEAAKKAFLSTIMFSLVGLGVALAMILAMPFFFKPFLADAMKFMDPSFYGTWTKRYFATADFVGAVWWFVIPLCIAAAFWVAWSLPNWIGKRREWCDENVIIYQLYRNFKGALFLATFASLTKSTGAEVTNQRNALMMLQSDVQPWLKWKIQAMLNSMDEKGALDASIFDVGLVDKEIYYRISDIFESRGLSDGLEVAGKESEQKAVASIQSRGSLLRTLVMGGALITVIALNMWVYACVYEFKTSVGVWASQ